MYVYCHFLNKHWPFLSISAGNAVQAGKKDWYSQEEIYQKIAFRACTFSFVVLAWINYFQIVDCFMGSSENRKYWAKSKNKMSGRKHLLIDENSGKKRVKERWSSELWRNRPLSSFGLFCLSCFTIDQTRMWIDYTVSATVIAFWMNLIFDSDCYSCRWLLAELFCSIVTFDSSWTALYQ